MIRNCELNVSACQIELWICNEPVVLIWGCLCVYRIDKRFFEVCGLYSANAHIRCTTSMNNEYAWYIHHTVSHLFSTTSAAHSRVFPRQNTKMWLWHWLWDCMYVCICAVVVSNFHLILHNVRVHIIHACCFFLFFFFFFFRLVFVSHHFIAYFISAQYAAYSVCACSSFLYYFRRFIMSNSIKRLWDNTYTTERHLNFWKKMCEN